MDPVLVRVTPLSEAELAELTANAGGSRFVPDPERYLTGRTSTGWLVTVPRQDVAPGA